MIYYNSPDFESIEISRKRKAEIFTHSINVKNTASPERSIVLEPQFGFKSGLVAILASLVLVGQIFSVGGNFALAQTNGVPVSPEVSAISQKMQPKTLVPQAGSETESFVKKESLLLKARRALAGGDVATAEKAISELRELKLAYTPTEDQPNFVADLIRQHQEITARLSADGSTEANRRAYADLLTRQALGLMLKGDLDTAEKLAQTADAQGVLFNPEAIQKGFDPKSILSRIKDIRLANRPQHSEIVPSNAGRQVSLAAQKQIAQIGETLREARLVLAEGKIDQAEALYRQVAALGIPDSQFPQGADTPGILQSDIAAYRLRNGNCTGVALAGGRAAVSPQNATQAHYESNVDTTQMRQVGNTTLSQDLSVQPLQGEAAPLRSPLIQTEPSGLLDQSERYGKSKTDQINAEMARDISAAYRIRTENPNEALNILFQGRAKIENSDLDPLQKQQNLRQLDFSIDATKRFVEQNRPQLELKEQNARVLEELQARRDDKDFVDQKIKELCEQVANCLDEGRHEDALYLANKANELAPEHPTVKILYLTTKMQNNIRTFDEIRGKKEDGFAGAMLDVQRASIPFSGDNPMQFDPKRWEKVRGRKGMDEIIGNLRPEREIEILKKMNMPVRLDFEEDVPLNVVLQYLQGYTGIMMMLDEQALLSSDIQRDQLIHVQLPGDISLKSALNLILGQLNLTYVVEDEVLKITIPSKGKGKTYTRTYYVGDLVIPIRNPAGDGGYHSMEAAYKRGMNEAMGRGQSMNGFGLAGNTQFASFGDGSQNMKIDPAILAQINPGGIAPNSGMGQMMGGGGGVDADFDTIIDLIESITGDDTSWENGSIQEYEPSLSLIIKQTEDVHSEIADLLKQLRKLNDLQVTVEVRYITITDDFFERIGVNFDMNFTNEGAKNKATITTEPDPLDPEQEIEVAKGKNVVVGIATPGVFTTDFNVPVTQNNYALATPQFGAYDPNAGISLGFAILSDIQAYFFMNAAQGDSRTNVLQAPKVTIFNGQYGSVSDMTQTPFVTSVVPVVADFSAAYQPVIVILNEGSTMTVQAVVSSDRQYVRLTMNPVFSVITNKTNTFRFSGTDETTTDETSKSKGDTENPTDADEKETGKKTTTSRAGVSVQQPVFASIQISTTVSVPDGGTVVMGGIKRLSEGRKEYGTPLLNKIPFVNRLFMNSSIGRQSESIMMMVTPRILIQEEEEAYMLGQQNP